MRVKVKVKHLIYSLLLIFAFLPILSHFIQPAIQMKVVSNNIEDGNMEKGKEQIVAMLENPASQAKKWELIRTYMIDQGYSQRFDVYTGPSMTSQTPIEGRLFTIDEMIPYVENYIKEAPSDGYIGSAAELVSNYYARRGELEEADQTLVLAADRFLSSDYQYRDLQVKRIELAIRQKEFERAKELIEEVKRLTKAKDIYFLGKVTEVEVEMLLRDGKTEQAYEKLKEDIEYLKKEWEEDSKRQKEQGISEEFIGQFDNITSFDQLITRRNLLEKALKNGEFQLVHVTGTIKKSNGEPMPNVGVYLRDEHEVNRSVTGEDRFQTITDQNGHYSFYSVIPGSYQIHLGFTYDQVDGWTWPIEVDEWITVEGTEDITYDITLHPLVEINQPANYVEISEDEMAFEWEGVPDTAYYKIGLSLHHDSGSIASPFVTVKNKTSITVPLEDLYFKRTGIMTDGDSNIEPSTLLGFANPEGLFSWYVEAYNEQGDLITQSDGYRLNEETMGQLPFFHLKARELTAADQLLLNSKFEEALDLYKENYSVNPDDLHSLRMITRLIGLGERSFDDLYSEEAFPYRKALASKYPTDETVYSVVDYYFEKEQWNEYMEWYEKYMAINEMPSSYVISRHGTALMKQGEILQAKKTLYEAMEEDNSHRFVGHLIALELYTNNSVEKAQEVANLYPQRGYDATDWGLMLEGLSFERAQKAITLFVEGKTEELNSYLKEVNNEKLTEFMKNVQDVR